VPGVWLRHDLEKRYKRLLGPEAEAEAREQSHVLTEEQIRVLEGHSAEFHIHHVATSAPWNC